MHVCREDHARTHSGKAATCRSKAEVLGETKSLDLGLLASTTTRNQFLLCKAPNWWYYVTAALANYYNGRSGLTYAASGSVLL